MKNKFSVGLPQDEAGTTVSFGERFQFSEQFDAVFREGMSLVERTAAYLDGQGRRESRELAPPAAVLYATESMRLTTRLLDLASWLLIRRSLKAGEITAEEAQRRRQKLKIGSVGHSLHLQGISALPQGLRALVEESFTLQGRIVKLDQAMTVQGSAPYAAMPFKNPVARQIRLIEEAFGPRLH